MSTDLTPRVPGGLPDDRQETLPVEPPSRPLPDYMEPEEGGVDLGRFLSALRRYKWWIVLVTVLGGVVGLGAAQFIPPEYESRTTLWIETPRPQEDRVGPIRPDELLQSSSWIELLKSGMVMEPVIRDLKLFVEPGVPEDSVHLSGLRFGQQFSLGTYRLEVAKSERSYTLERAGGVVVEEGAFGDSVGAELGFQWTPDLGSFPEDRPVEFTVRSPQEVGNELSNRIDTQLDRNGNFLRLTLQGHDPRLIANTLNQLTDQYVSVAADLKRARLDELVEILEQQVDYALERLRQAEIALQDFRVQTVTLPSDRSTPVAPGLQMTQDPVFGNFFNMRIQLEDIRRQQDLIRRALDPAADAPLETLRSVPAIQGSADMVSTLDELTRKRAELRALRYRYTDEHPPVQQLLSEIETLETQTIPALVRTVLADLEAQEGQLEQRIGSASQELEAIPPRTIEEARLTRSVESANNLYTNLLRRYEEARLSAASSIPDIRVLDRAVVPQRPIRNDKPQIILLAMVGGLGLGLVGALLRDRLDRRLHYPGQVTDDLGLTILAGIPRIHESGWLREDNKTQAQESFRSLRLNVMHAFGSAGPVTVTVTSPGPGDGKSFVTANLGRAFADIGKKTLLIDGDTRRGKLHEVLGVQRKPGLVDLLRNSEEDSARSAIRPTNHDGLFLLPCGSRVHEGPELLSSRRMRDLVLRLRSDFDVILVDSPPLGAGVDPFVLGTLTAAMLLVLRTGETDRELADTKLELLERLPIRVLGAVLNGVPTGREYRYYSYTAGYESRSEEEAHAPPLLEK